MNAHTHTARKTCVQLRAMERAKLRREDERECASRDVFGAVVAIDDERLWSGDWYT